MNQVHRYLRLIALLLFIWLFFYLVQTLPMFNRSELAALLDTLQESTDAGLIFIAATTLLCIFFVPISWFIAAGAVLFGLLRGFAYSLTAATIAAVLSFLIAKFLRGSFPAYLQKKLQNRRLPVNMDNMGEHMQTHGLKIMFLLRNIPLVPFVVVNYVSGISSIKFSTFLIGSLLGMVPGIFVSTFFFTRVAHTATDPAGAAIGLMVKLTYLGTVLAIEKKIRKRKALLTA